MSTCCPWVATTCSNARQPTINRPSGSALRSSWDSRIRNRWQHQHHRQQRQSPQRQHHNQLRHRIPDRRRVDWDPAGRQWVVSHPVGILNRWRNLETVGRHGRDHMGGTTKLAVVRHRSRRKRGSTTACARLVEDTLAGALSFTVGNGSTEVTMARFEP
jgi:hypothetical protein